MRNELKVENFSLECDTERAGTFEPLRFVPRGKNVVLGLVATKTGALECADDIVRRIEAAAKYVPLKQLTLRPQCGFASMAEDNVITEDEQWQKLRFIIEGAERGVADGLANLRERVETMTRTMRLIAGIAVTVIARGQGLVTHHDLSLPMAKTIAEATLSACKEKGFHTAVAVVDRGGQVLVILRDEEATEATVEMARRKAYTARMFGSSTLDFEKRTSDPAFSAQRDVSGVLALGGGVPIRAGNEIIGGVASSGAGQEQDDACAKAGVAKAADLLK